MFPILKLMLKRADTEDFVYGDYRAGDPDVFFNIAIRAIYYQVCADIKRNGGLLVSLEYDKEPYWEVLHTNELAPPIPSIFKDKIIQRQIQEET